MIILEHLIGQLAVHSDSGTSHVTKIELLNLSFPAFTRKCPVLAYLLYCTAKIFKGTPSNFPSAIMLILAQ